MGAPSWGIRRRGCAMHRRPAFHGDVHAPQTATRIQGSGSLWNVRGPFFPLGQHGAGCGRPEERSGYTGGTWAQRTEGDMTERSIDELGPVDYVIVEFPVGQQHFTGEGADELLR